MYIKPIVVFEAPVCTIVGDRVTYYTKINFSNGNYYAYIEPCRGCKTFEIIDGRSWSYTLYENFKKEHVFPAPGRTVTFSNRILYVTAYGVGKDSFELPPISNATCK
jgi:hypothetical protein